MKMHKERFPWQLEILTKEIIERKSEMPDMIEEALAILSPRYIECIKLFNRSPDNKIIKHNYYLLATLYELLKYSTPKKKL
jgi:hypothetical protein